MASLRARAVPLARSSLSSYLCGGNFPSRSYATSPPQDSSSSPTPPLESSEETKSQSTPQSTPQSAPVSPRNSLSSLSRALGLGDGQGRPAKSLEEYSSGYRPTGEHHLHVYAHKHNTHLTLSAPAYLDPETNRMRQKVLMTLSTGNIGYKKAARGTYEAAFQLGGYVFSRIQLDGIIHKIQRLEITLRGFGQGREAVTKLLLGQEGAALRDRVIRVTDASRVKMGGQRAPKPRRLG